MRWTDLKPSSSRPREGVQAVHEHATRSQLSFVAFAYRFRMGKGADSETEVYVEGTKELSAWCAVGLVMAKESKLRFFRRAQSRYGHVIWNIKTYAATTGSVVSRLP